MFQIDFRCFLFFHVIPITHLMNGAVLGVDRVSTRGTPKKKVPPLRNSARPWKMNDVNMQSRSKSGSWKT